MANALMGKSPEVRFKKYKDWKNGTNSGTAGNFDHDGAINPFSPGP